MYLVLKVENEVYELLYLKLNYINVNSKYFFYFLIFLYL